MPPSKPTKPPTTHQRILLPVGANSLQNNELWMQSIVQPMLDRLFGRAVISKDSTQANRAQIYVSQDAILRHIAELAQSNNDIASFHAHRLALEWAYTRKLWVAAADRFLNSRKQGADSDEVAKDERSLQKLTDAVAEIAPKAFEFAWEHDHLVRQDILHGCSLIDSEQSKSDADKETLHFAYDNVIRSNAVIPVPLDEMLRPDAKLATFIEGIGQAGKIIAERIRTKAKERWLSFSAKCEEIKQPTFDEEVRHPLDPELLALPKLLPSNCDYSVLWGMWLCIDNAESPNWARALLEAVWVDSVRPLLQKTHQPVSITRAVAIDVLDLYSQRYDKETKNGQQVLVFPGQRGWVLVPSILDGTLGTILKHGVDMLTSEVGLDLLEWEITEAHQQYMRDPNSDFRHIAVDGGWHAIAHDKLGLSKKESPQIVRAITLAQAHLRFESYGIRGNLLSYAEPRSNAPGRRSLVTITLGDMLLYGFAHALREAHGSTSLASREGRRLVPLLGKAPLIGRRNDFAAQRRMVWRFAVALRDRATELAKNNCVVLPIDDWTRIASEANAPRSGGFLLRVIKAWATGSDNVPPLIECIEKDTYTLHKSRKDALNFIVAGGQTSILKSNEGKSSAKARSSRKKPKETK